MNRRLCRECKQPIPKERIDALPETDTCVGCSNVKPRTAADVDIDVSADSEHPTDTSDARSLGRRI